MNPRPKAMTHSIGKQVVIFKGFTALTVNLCLMKVNVSLNFGHHLNCDKYALWKGHKNRCKRPQPEILEAFRRKVLFKPHGSIRYLFRPASDSRVFWLSSCKFSELDHTIKSLTHVLGFGYYELKWPAHWFQRSKPDLR